MNNYYEWTKINPIQDGEEGGGGKKPPYQFFLYNFCKHRN